MQVDITIHFDPFELIISINHGLFGSPIEVNKLANMAAAFNYNSHGRTAAGHAWNNPHFMTPPCGHPERRASVRMSP